MIIKTTLVTNLTWGPPVNGPAKHVEETSGQVAHEN